MPGSRLLGNDLVDLTDPAAQTQAANPRFLQRILTPRELAVLEQAPDRHRQLWAFWALKEAAFKAGRQHEPALRFLPRQFEVDWPEKTGWIGHGQVLCRVLTPVGPLAGQLNGGADWVHALAAESPAGLTEAVWQVGSLADLARNVELDQPDQFTGPGSAEVRLLARRLLAEAGLPRTRIVRRRLEAGTWGIPRVERNGEVLPVPVSLSHDGRWAAAAVRPLGAIFLNLARDNG